MDCGGGVVASGVVGAARALEARARFEEAEHLEMWWWCLAFGGGERVMVRVLRCLSRWGTWSPMQRGVELAPLPLSPNCMLV